MSRQSLCQLARERFAACREFALGHLIEDADKAAHGFRAGDLDAFETDEAMFQDSLAAKEFAESRLSTAFAALPNSLTDSTVVEHSESPVRVRGGWPGAGWQGSRRSSGSDVTQRRERALARCVRSSVRRRYDHVIAALGGHARPDLAPHLLSIGCLRCDPFRQRGTHSRRGAVSPTATSRRRSGYLQSGPAGCTP